MATRDLSFFNSCKISDVGYMKTFMFCISHYHFFTEEFELNLGVDYWINSLSQQLYGIVANHTAHGSALILNFFAQGTFFKRLAAPRCDVKFASMHGITELNKIHTVWTSSRASARIVNCRIWRHTMTAITQRPCARQPWQRPIIIGRHFRLFT
jgi:hypothetical protein